MPMNRMHQRLCSSAEWAQGVKDQLLPWALNGVDLGDDVLEIGPGYGATTRVLIDRAPRLTAIELDPALARDLDTELRERATIVTGSGAELPFPDASFSAVVCFTMLHHIPTRAEQDAVFAEACRVLKPGGVFAGSDSQPSLRFRFLHLGDTMTVVDPRTAPARLERAGFTSVRVDLAPKPKRALRFAAHKPGRPGRDG
ncbi:MAG: methyltransferase domain-containing protein [Streptosporangiales bacterium]|nr:methyltransferase domain-containing protein [Streptosporangiales bacterium]